MAGKVLNPLATGALLGALGMNAVDKMFGSGNQTGGCLVQPDKIAELIKRKNLLTKKDRNMIL